MRAATWKKIGSLWLHVPSDMKNGIIRNEPWALQALGTKMFWCLLSASHYTFLLYKLFANFCFVHLNARLVIWMIKQKKKWDPFFCEFFCILKCDFPYKRYTLVRYPCLQQIEVAKISHVYKLSLLTFLLRIWK